MILFITGCASSDLEEFAYGVLVAATEESERSNTQGINYDGNPAVYCSQLKNTYRTIQRNLSTYDRNIREYENQGRKANNKSRADWYNRKANQERRAKNADLKKINENLSNLFNKTLEQTGYVNSKIDEIGVLTKKMTNAMTANISDICLLYTSPSPRDGSISRMPSSA